MDETQRLIRRSSRFAILACILSLGALLCSGTQAYFFWKNQHGTEVVAAPVENNAPAPIEPLQDPRSDLSLEDLVRRAPSIKTGNLQAWWAGEQARQVLRLEAQAKHQLLAGDRDGANRTLARADEIRSQIPTLAESEKPPQRYSTISSVAR
ncbi:MAG: hypothetical protein ACXWG0_01325 [Chthoniobacterales bacterium]